MRDYREKVFQDKTSGSIPEIKKDMNSKKLGWITPKGWIEKKGNGMRLATFLNETDTSEVICTVVPIRGKAGGLKANIVRWSKQLGIDFDSSDELDRFIAQQSRFNLKDGTPVILIDFSSLLSEKSTVNERSMMVTIITLPEMTVFIKMTGKQKKILENRAKFVSFCQSFSLK